MNTSIQTAHVVCCCRNNNRPYPDLIQYCYSTLILSVTEIVNNILNVQVFGSKLQYKLQYILYYIIYIYIYILHYIMYLHFTFKFYILNEADLHYGNDSDFDKDDNIKMVI